MTLTVAALCMGYGGLEMGLQLAGIDCELAWCAEIDPHASKIIAHRWPGVLNLGDLTKITDPEPVDIVTAGFPCQPFSVAGARKGTEDERWLIDDVCRVARLARASTLVLENVTGLLTANDGDALARVCQALAFNGFDRWRWTTLRAADVGAPHGRHRWFCVAVADAERSGWPGRSRTARRQEVERAATGGPSEGALADADDAGRIEQRRPVPTTTQHPATERRGQTAADADGGPLRAEPFGVTGCCDPAEPRSDRQAPPDADSGRLARLPQPDGDEAQRSAVQQRHDAHRCGLGDERVDTFGPYAAAVARWERVLGRPAPDPTTDGRLSPMFVEWMMGLPEGHVTDVPDLSRAQMLRALGNGVVMQQAAAAIRALGSC